MKERLIDIVVVGIAVIIAALTLYAVKHYPLRDIIEQTEKSNA